MERVLEVQNAIGALGPGLAEEFLGLAQQLDPEQAAEMRQRVAAHLDSSSKAMEENEFIDLKLAKLVAEKCLELFDHYPSFSPDAQAAVIGAARYFIQSQDTYHDTVSSLGFEDDAMIVNYVIANISTDINRIPLKQ